MISSHAILGQGISGFAAKIKTFDSITKRQGPEGKTSLQVSEDTALASVYSKINATKSGYNSIYAGIRAADKTMDKIGGILDRMKSDLEGVAKKTYPPYPPGSEERTRVLKSYSSLRRLISQLTIPPDRQDAAKALDIPELPEDATDKDIQGAIHSIDNATQILRQRQADLARDAVQISHSLNIGDAEGVELNQGSEYMVGKSEELKNSLAQDPAYGLTNARTQLAVLLE